MWNEFIANKITLKCINKNRKIICFTFVFSPLFAKSRVSASTFCFFSLSSLLPRHQTLCVIVSANILRYQGEIFSRLTHPEYSRKKSFQQFYRRENSVMGPQIKHPLPFSEKHSIFKRERKAEKSKLSNITHNLMA